MMYRYWWTTNGSQMLGKTVVQQRENVLNNAGIRYTNLQELETALASWPPDQHYSTEGDFNQLSYLTYLLAPMIPDGNPDYQITWSDGHLSSLTPASHAVPSPPTHNPLAIHPPNPLGWMLALLSVFGAARLSTWLLHRSHLSAPESIAAALLLLTTLGLLSRMATHSTHTGMVLFAGLSIIGWLTLFRHKQTQDASPPTSSPALINSRKWVLVLVTLISAGVVWSLLMGVTVVPNDWDAWAIWGPKARVLAQGHGPLTDVQYFGHADYPLLWPMTWAYTAWISGGWEEQWALGWGPVFMLLTAWQIAHILHQQGQSATHALLGAALFVSIPKTQQIASTGYAEPALWLMVTCAFGRILLYHHKRTLIHAALAGLFAAAAAHTKNEGLMIAMVFLAAILACHNRQSLKHGLVYLLVLGAGMAPWMIWLKTELQAPSHSLAGLSLNPDDLSRALDRLPAALERIGVLWIQPQLWSVVLWLGLAGSLYRMITGNWTTRRLAILPWLIMAGMLTIMLFHKDDIGWQINTAWDRLTMQVLPLLLIPTLIFSQKKSSSNAQPSA